MDNAHREFFEDLGREFDGWARVATEAVSEADSDLTWAGEAAPAISRLREALGTPDLVDAFDVSTRQVLTGLLHSVMVSLDGGTQLADKLRLRLETQDGQEMGPGLNELLFEHFHDTGRLPVSPSNQRPPESNSNQRSGMKDVSPGSAWVPTDLTISDAAVASIFVMSLPDGIAVRFTEYKRSDLEVRAWMRRWFEDGRDKYQREMPAELAEPTGMISLIVERAKSGDEYALVEGRVSSYPVVPEDWPEVAYAELFARAIAFLS